VKAEEPPALALDLGGTQVRAAVVTTPGRVGSAVRIPTPVDEGPDAVVEACVTALRQAWASEGAHVRPAAIGICTPGPVDPFRGVVVDPPNLGPRFRDVPLRDRVAASLGLPAVLDRDTQVAALAEGRLGAAVGATDYLYITISTGIGGAIVSGGRLLRGPDGGAGEVGHIVVDRTGPRCGCGATGHLEAISAGVAVARAGREAAESGRSPALRRAVAAHGASFGARHVADAEAAGDPVAAAILADARDAFARACVSFVDLFNPEVIVVGGGLVLGDAARWLGPANERVRREAFRLAGRRARIVPARLGDDVGLVGAYLLAVRGGPAAVDG
jgi:glucokinase